MPTSWRSLAELGEDDRDGWTICCQFANCSSVGPKSTPGRLKMDLRRPQNGARIVHGRLGGVRNAQDRPKNGPRDFQERPKSVQERPKSVQEAPKSSPRGAQETPRRAQETPRGAEFGLQGVQNPVRIKKQSLPERIALSIAFSTQIFNMCLQKLV